MTDCLSLNATTGRVTQLAREKEEKRAQDRRRSLLHLIAAFLSEQGYINSADTLFKEAQLSREIQVCDNIDLETIILEYSDYYYAKFNRYPKLCKKSETNVCNVTHKKEKAGKNNYRSDDNKITDESNTVKNKVSQKIINDNLSNELNLVGMTVTPIFPSESGDRIQSKAITGKLVLDNGKLLKPIGDLYPAGSEWRDIADVISKEIVLKDLNIHWDDIKGLESCKALLKEATVYPMKYPALFTGKLDPWKGILLYGPPGTGKTMLAKAIATECHCTFFNITSSSIISKWRGDSEKYIRVLTDLAKYYAPTIIFIDEIDWTTANGDYTSTNSEPARRFRAEFLARLDGLLSMENTNVILLAATNVPWNIDVALLRRLEKRIFVDLPDENTRLQILKFYVHEDLHETKEFVSVVKDTDGYSCADLKLLCKEAWMNQLRPIWKCLESKKISLNDIRNDGVISKISYLTMAMNYIRPTVKHISEHYIHWNKKFGFTEHTQ